MDKSLLLKKPSQIPKKGNDDKECPSGRDTSSRRVSNLPGAGTTVTKEQAAVIRSGGIKGAYGD